MVLQGIYKLSILSFNLRDLLDRATRSGDNTRPILVARGNRLFVKLWSDPGAFVVSFWGSLPIRQVDKVPDLGPGPLPVCLIETSAARRQFFSDP